MPDFEKATYEDLDEDKRSRLERFRNMPIGGLEKILPCWAVKEKLSELMNFRLHPEMGIYVFVEVPPQRVLNKVELLGLPTSSIFNDDASDFRFITTLERWEMNLPVDPATIRIGSTSDSIKISDGRHRVILSSIISDQPIPVAVPMFEAEEIIKLLKD